MLFLTFNEPVNVTTLVPDQFTLQSQMALTSGEFYRLTGGVSTIYDTDIYPNTGDVFFDTIVQFQLSDRDLNELKKIPNLVTERDNTYLVLGPGSVLDTSRNPAEQVLNGSALRAFAFTMDETSPQLLNFSVDLDFDLVSLTFSETINVETVNFSALTFFGNSTTLQPSFTLTNGNINSNNDVILNFSFFDDDINTIKLNRDLLTNLGDTFLFLSQNAIRDMNNNYHISQNFSNILPVSDFKEDKTSPIIEAYLFDLNIGQIRLFFSEPVDTQTFQPMMITLSNMPNDVGRSINLSEGNVSLSSHIVNISLSIDDTNFLKRYPDFIIDINTTYLSISSSLVTDMNYNNVEAIDIFSSLQPILFISDTTQPELVEFSLDMTGSTRELPLRLLLTFSETINSSSFLPSLSFVDKFGVPTQISYLTSGTVIPVSDNELEIIILDSDLDEIKMKPPLLLFSNHHFCLF